MVGIVAGLLHGASVPLVLLLPDTEITPVFATSGMLIAGWVLGTGITGLRSADARPARPTAALAGGAR